MSENHPQSTANAALAPDTLPDPLGSVSFDSREAGEVSPESIAAGHELSDASPKGITLFGVTLAATLGIILAVTLGLFYLTAWWEAKDEATIPLVSLQSPPPTPPLQPMLGHERVPYQDMAEYLSTYDRLSHTYGRVTMADHQVHALMPVDAAMALLASQGLPHDQAKDIPAPQGSAPSMDTPYSTGGRGTRMAPGTGPEMMMPTTAPASGF